MAGPGSWNPLWLRKGGFGLGVARTGILLAAEAPCRWTRQARPPSPKGQRHGSSQCATWASGCPPAQRECWSHRFGGLGLGMSQRQGHWLPGPQPQSSTTEQPRKCLIGTVPRRVCRQGGRRSRPHTSPPSPSAAWRQSERAWNQTADLGPAWWGPAELRLRDNA